MTWTTKTSDTCDRADQPMNGTTLDNGLGGSETNTWSDVGTTDWFITSNRAVKGSGSGTTTIVSSTATSTAQRVSAVAYVPTNGNIGLWGFYNTSTNAAYLFYRNTTGSLILYFDGAAFNTVISGGPVINDASRMLLECTNGAQIASVDGSTILTGSDTHLTSGVFGIYSEGTNGFDDIKYEVNVTASPPTNLQITTAPVGNQSGVNLTTQPVVAVRDVSNVTVTTDTSTVTATLNTVSGSGTLSGTTAVAAVAGVATFTNLKVTGTGQFTITFTDGSLTAATSAAFYVGATKLAVTGQPTVAYTQRVPATNFTVAVQDPGGTTVGNATNSITIVLTVISGSATLTAGTATRAAVAGVGTFNDLVVTCSDGAIWTYAVSASGLTGTTSSPITGVMRSLDVPANFT